ncbi:hypothetical protein CEE45_00395 [Candidatus Heimdallarchaeota archaeon B3_Heim]|nr:MAG: hypothetical protein CEE45_00395 [Candidatus Heimdallarchaeota archaeon B3_Heim]
MKFELKMLSNLFKNQNYLSRSVLSLNRITLVNSHTLHNIKNKFDLKDIYFASLRYKGLSASKVTFPIAINCLNETLKFPTMKTEDEFNANSVGLFAFPT